MNWLEYQMLPDGIITHTVWGSMKKQQKNSIHIIQTLAVMWTIDLITTININDIRNAIYYTFKVSDKRKNKPEILYNRW